MVLTGFVGLVLAVASWGSVGSAISIRR